jgi:hypothetical protein
VPFEAELFPGIREDLAKLLLPIIAVAQIRLALSNSAKEDAVQSLVSVNSYIRAGLAKSEPLVRVAAAAAIRKTITVYTNDSDNERLLTDYDDLTQNLSGPIITRGGLASHLGNPE